MPAFSESAAAEVGPSEAIFHLHLNRIGGGGDTNLNSLRNFKFGIFELQEAGHCLTLASGVAASMAVVKCSLLLLLCCTSLALNAVKILSNGAAAARDAVAAVGSATTGAVAHTGAAVKTAGAALGSGLNAVGSAAASTGAVLGSGLNAVGSAAAGAGEALESGLDTVGSAVSHSVASVGGAGTHLVRGVLGAVGVHVEEGLENLAQLESAFAPALNLSAAFPLPAEAVAANMEAWRSHFTALLAPVPLAPPFPSPPYSSALQGQRAQALLADTMQRIELELLPQVAMAQGWLEDGVKGGPLMYALRGLRSELEVNRAEDSSSATAAALHNRVLDACLRQIDGLAPPFVSRTNASGLAALLGKATPLLKVKGTAPAAQGANYLLKRAAKIGVKLIPYGALAVEAFEYGSSAMGLVAGRSAQVGRILSFRELANTTYSAFLELLAHVEEAPTDPEHGTFEHEWTRLQGYAALDASLEKHDADAAQQAHEDAAAAGAGSAAAAAA